MASRLRAILALALTLVALLGFAVPAAAQGLSFTAPGPLQSDTGHILVEWDAPGATTLSIAQEPDFADAKPLYVGTNHAYFLSGLAGGEYYLRLQDDNGATSEVISLTVVHQSLQRAIWLTVIGAIITLGTILTIFRGARP